MVFTQLHDAENKLNPARTQIKYCMSLTVLLVLWFCCENYYDKPKNCYDKRNEIKCLGPQKWGIFIRKGVRLYLHTWGLAYWKNSGMALRFTPVRASARVNVSSPKLLNQYIHETSQMDASYLS